MTGTVLVTGGNGLLGRGLVDALLSQGRSVRVLDIETHPNPAVETVIGDVRDPAATDLACNGVETVFHTVAIVDQHPARAPLLEDVNLNGTRNMLRAARQAGTARFVFTSSIDVVCDGTAISNGNESIPYPKTFLNAYGRTKAAAEQAVLAANSPGFATCSLRTAGIFGPHDRNRLPVVIGHVRRNGFVPMGDGRARFSHVFVDNAVHAHVLAAAALRPGAAHAGKAYFVTDHEPSNFFSFVEPYLADLGIKRAPLSVPTPVAEFIARVTEGVYAVVGPRLARQPLLTRYTVAVTCRDFWFNHDAATRDFGYTPIVSAAEARARTLTWLRAYEAAQSPLKTPAGAPARSGTIEAAP